MAERRTVIAVSAAGAVALLVTAAVLLFGVRRLPAFPAVSDAPALDVPGTLAYLADGDEGACVVVVAASGVDPVTLLCADGTSELAWITEVGWTPAGRVLVYGHGEFSEELALVVDPATAQVVRRLRLARPDGLPPPPLPDSPDAGPPDRRTRADGAVLLVGGGDGKAKVAVRDGDVGTRTIVSVTGPRDYAFTDALWSPDGEWALVQDTDRRLLVVAADGDPGPRLLVGGGAGGPSRGEPGALAWFVPGHHDGTTDPDTLPLREDAAAPSA